jgi:hypothetical protein
VPQLAYKSYCWAVGTTSFRTVDFNVRIEGQLALLNEFWALSGNAERPWREAQLDYYRFMQERKFVKGDAPNPTKDAREKTAGLAAIGLTDGERRLTPVGKALLTVAQSGNFAADNPLQLPADSYIYLQQLLKTACNIDGAAVRPYVVLVYALLELGHLSDDEFTYLLPLCTTAENTAIVVEAIRKLRRDNGSIAGVILSRLLAMENYQSALTFFIKSRVTESVITAIGMNRKSGGTGGKAYDKSYYPFFETLREKSSLLRTQLRKHR